MINGVGELTLEQVKETLQDFEFRSDSKAHAIGTLIRWAEEREAYRALGTVEHLAELVKASREGRVLPDIEDRSHEIYFNDGMDK